MIVWSRGLGRQRLPLVLADAVPSATHEYLVMEGTIEPVCWNYAIRLAPEDLTAFLKLMARPATASFMAERGGVLFPFVRGLLAVLPRLVMKLVSGPKMHPAE